MLRGDRRPRRVGLALSSDRTVGDSNEFDIQIATR